MSNCWPPLVFFLCFFVELLRVLTEPAIAGCFLLAHTAEKLLDAERNIALRRVMNSCVNADPQPARK